MKKIIMLGLAFIMMSVFLEGCFIGFEDHDRRGHENRWDHGERHEDRHEDRR